ncbi:MAG: acyl-CoA dehydrogenase [Tabrizicola sp.]|nr:acyl-CoA dehydrogenase [Tabrizicola sp.]
MPYRAPLNDCHFILTHVAGFADVAATERFAAATPDLVNAVLGEAARISSDVLAPLNRISDKVGARLENGVVASPPGFDAGYRAIAEGGWIGISADPAFGGMGLPMALSAAVDDMMAGGCIALQVKPLLTKGQIEALEHHASDDLKALYLPKLISGEWSGTMNLTEPQAGSDVGALRARAEPLGDGTYAVTGQKIYISWGDSDLVTNVCHLILARLPDAADGTRGISLFIVPKFLPDPAGKPGARNGVRVVSIEHKLGLHGSPTCVMQFDGAKGWLVGKPNRGMAAMFTMTNNARLGVAVQGVGVAEAALQHALAYALGRRQGETPVPGMGTIIDHADVRRMLASMRAEVFAARAIALSCAVATDMAVATGRAEWAARAALLTPIAKAYGTDVGSAVSHQGVQVFGGMGFIEDTGAAQFVRDVRITAIYEGTNGIQAMDLVGRKMADGGEAAFRMIDEIQRGAEVARGTLPDLAGDVWAAAETLRDATERLVAQGLNDRFAGAVPYLRAFARVLGGHLHLKAALVESVRLPLARVMIRRLLPEHEGLLAEAREGAAGLYAVSPGDLAA